MEFSKVIKRSGSTQKTVNVSLNGQPFGQLWAWNNTRTERHPWHAKPLNGEHATFETLAAAKSHMVQQAGL